MFFLIETDEQLREFQSKNFEEVFVEFILYNDNVHPILNNISSIYIRPLYAKKGYLATISHNEALSCDINTIFALLQNYNRIFARNKKLISHFYKGNNILDISILNPDLNISTNSPIHNFYYSKYKNIKDINTIIPIVKQYERWEEIYTKIEPIIKEAKIPTSYNLFNDEGVKVFTEIEKQGIKINPDIFHSKFELTNVNNSVEDNIVYTEYNLNTITKRPSNCFNNVNFAALNKTDGSKKSFIPRNDMFVEIDYKAYHIYLLAQLIGYEIKRDIYEELGEFLGIEDYNEVKQKTFGILYTNQIYSYLHIEFFKKVQEFKSNLWNQIQKQQYPEEYLIDWKHLVKPTQLLPYILQNIETEHNIKILGKVINYLKEKNSKVVLYTYDSFLIDFSKSDGKQTLDELIVICKNDYFKLNIKAGKNLGELENFGIF